MLDTLSAADFRDLLNQTISITIHDQTTAMKLDEITEHPKSSPPRSSAQRRTPFSLILTCALEGAIDIGLCTIKHPKLGDIENISINRITPLSIEEPLAWYEIIFN